MKAPGYNEEARATYWSAKIEDGLVKEHMKHFSWVTLSPSLAWLSSKRDPFSKDLSPWEKGELENTCRPPPHHHGFSQVLPLRIPSVFASAGYN